MNNAQKKEYFELHPEVNEFYFTEDFAFEHRDHAYDHAKATGQKDPERLSRAEAALLEDKSQKTVMAKEPSGESVDYSKWTNAELKQLLTEKQIEFDEKATKAQLIELLNL